MPTSEIQRMQDELSPQGKQQFEEIKKAVGIYYENDPSVPFFLGVVSQLDRLEKFAPKFAEVVRKSCHETREDAVKCSKITLSQVIEKGMAEFRSTATHEMTEHHAAAIRVVAAEATEIIRRAQPPTRNWRLWASVALVAQVGLLGSVGFGGWWYRDHQTTESTAWSETWRGKQAREFHEIIEKSATASMGGNAVLQPGGTGEKQLRSILAWAVTESGAKAYFDQVPADTATQTKPKKK